MMHRHIRVGEAPAGSSVPNCVSLVYCESWRYLGILTYSGEPRENAIHFAPILPRHISLAVQILPMAPGDCFSQTNHWSAIDSSLSVN